MAAPYKHHGPWGAGVGDHHKGSGIQSTRPWVNLAVLQAIGGEGTIPAVAAVGAWDTAHLLRIAPGPGDAALLGLRGQAHSSHQGGCCQPRPVFTCVLAALVCLQAAGQQQQQQQQQQQGGAGVPAAEALLSSVMGDVRPWGRKAAELPLTTRSTSTFLKKGQRGGAPGAGTVGAAAGSAAAPPTGGVSLRSSGGNPYL
jgi:hypothetical protein